MIRGHKPMKSDRVVVVAGASADAVDPVREVLEHNGVFAVACCDLSAPLLNGKTASLVIVCSTASADGEVPRRECPTLRHLQRYPSSDADRTFARAAEIARNPVPVVFVHERPTVEDVNYLRSCGAYYVVDRRADERCGWRRLLECVAETLAGEVECSFCERRVARLDGCVQGIGQAKLCRDCLSFFARNILSRAPEAGYRPEGLARGRDTELRP